MKWIVGLDLRRRSAGALQLARWVGTASRAADGERFVGVHVLEQEHLEVLLRTRHLDEVLELARTAAEESVRAEGAEAVVRDVRVVQAPEASEALLEAVASGGADGLVVGRAAPGSAGVRIVRLGRVARRLLRRAAVPLVIVPPDVEAGALGEGPVVALVRLDARSISTARHAALVAGRLGRPLALLHVLPPSAEQTAPYLSAELGEQVAAEQRVEGERALAAWVASSGLSAPITAVVQGHPVDAALAFAEGNRAPLLVVGARPLRGVAAALVTGTAAVLASLAPSPVMVVPSAE